MTALLDAGADVNAMSKIDKTALKESTLAFYRGRFKRISAFLRSRGALSKAELLEQRKARGDVEEPKDFSSITATMAVLATVPTLAGERLAFDAVEARAVVPGYSSVTGYNDASAAFAALRDSGRAR